MSKRHPLAKIREAIAGLKQTIGKATTNNLWDIDKKAGAENITTLLESAKFQDALIHTLAETLVDRMYHSFKPETREGLVHERIREAIFQIEQQERRET